MRSMLNWYSFVCVLLIMDLIRYLLRMRNGKFVEDVMENYPLPKRGAPYHAKRLTKFWQINYFISRPFFLAAFICIDLEYGHYVFFFFILYVLLVPFFYLYTRKAKRFRVQAEAVDPAANQEH